MCEAKIVFGDSGKRDPYIIKRVKLDGEVFYEVYRNDSEVNWRYRWIADASTYDEAKCRILEDRVMQMRLRAALGGL